MHARALVVAWEKLPIGARPCVSVCTHTACVSVCVCVCRRSMLSPRDLTAQIKRSPSPCQREKKTENTDGFASVDSPA